MAKGEIIIPKVWRSELKGVIAFLFLSLATVYLSHLIPFTVLRGDIYRSSQTIVFLRLPLFWLIPSFVLGSLLIRIYDVKYSMNSNGIEARTGIVSFNQIVTRVRYEDVRGVEVVQTVLDRLLEVGILEISTSATGGVEITMEGIAYPIDVQDAILAERDRRQKISFQMQEQSFAEKTPQQSEEKLYEVGGKAV